MNFLNKEKNKKVDSDEIQVKKVVASGEKIKKKLKKETDLLSSSLLLSGFLASQLAIALRRSFSRRIEGCFFE